MNWPTLFELQKGPRCNGQKSKFYADNNKNRVNLSMVTKGWGMGGGGRNVISGIKHVLAHSMEESYGLEDAVSAGRCAQM